MPVTVFAVAGPSSSGKTTLCKALAEHLRRRYGDGSVALLSQDNYYRDQTHLPESARLSVNYDHPDTIEFSLLAKHIAQLKTGAAVDTPTFDYIKCARTGATTRVKPAPILIVEGILVLNDPGIRAVADLRIYVEAPLDICFIRRARKYMTEWGRSYDSVVEQFDSKVRPMFYEFIEPSKNYADIIIPGENVNTVGISILEARAAELLKKNIALSHL